LKTITTTAKIGLESDRKKADNNIENSCRCRKSQKKSVTFKKEKRRK